MRKIISSIIFGMVLILMTPLVLGASWSGYVLDESGSGINTVNVTAILASNTNFVNVTFTDSSGSFIIGIPDSTSVRLVSSKSGFVTDTTTSLPPITSDSVLPFNITLVQAIPGNIIGRVTDSGGSGIVNAIISAIQGGSTIKSTSTDSGGDYTLASLTDGTYTIQANATSYLAQELTNIVVLQNSTTSVNFTLALAPVAPVISNIKVGSITNSEATITYTTNELSNSSVDYGTTTALGLTESSIFFVISHSISLSNLDKSTFYFFNVTSCDSTNDCNTQGPFSFITLSDSVSAVGNGESEGRSSIAVPIPKPKPTPTLTTPTIPAQLLDVKLELEDEIITSSNKLTAIITFENFGTDPALVSLNYIILNEFGKEVYNEFGEIIVYTESVITKKFDYLKLDLGKYKLVLKIEYGDGVTEEFEQSFEVRKSLIIKYFIYSLIGFFALILIFLIFYIIKLYKKKH